MAFNASLDIGVVMHGFGIANEALGVLERSLERVAETTGLTSKVNKVATRSSQSLRAAQDKEARQQRVLNDLRRDGLTGTASYRSAQRSLQKATARVSAEQKNHARVMEDVSDVQHQARISGFKLGQTLSTVVSRALGDVTKGVIQAGIQMQQLMLTFNAVKTEAEDVTQTFRELVNISKLPGIDFQQAVKGVTQLRATKMSADLAKSAVVELGNALASVGAPEELHGVIRALSQIQSKGKVYAEEIYQIAERLPQIRTIMLDVFGTADTEVLAKEGIGAEEFTRNIINGLKKLPRVQENAANSLQNLENAWMRLKSAVGDELLKAFQNVVDLLTSFVEWFNLLDKAILKNIGTWLAQGTAITGVMGVLFSLQAIVGKSLPSMLMSLGGFLRQTTQGVTGLRVSLLTLGTAAKTAGKALAGLGLMAVIAAVVVKVTFAIAEHIKKQKELKKAIEDSKNHIVKYDKALEKIEKTTDKIKKGGSIVDALIQESKVLEVLTKQYGVLTGAKGKSGLARKDASGARMESLLFDLSLEFRDYIKRDKDTGEFKFSDPKGDVEFSLARDAGSQPHEKWVEKIRDAQRRAVEGMSNLAKEDLNNLVKPMQNAQEHWERESRNLKTFTTKIGSMSGVEGWGTSREGKTLQKAKDTLFEELKVVRRAESGREGVSDFETKSYMLSEGSDIVKLLNRYESKAIESGASFATLSGVAEHQEFWIALDGLLNDQKNRAEAVEKLIITEKIKEKPNRSGIATQESRLKNIQISIVNIQKAMATVHKSMTTAQQKYTDVTEQYRKVMERRTRIAEGLALNEKEDDKFPLLSPFFSAQEAKLKPLEHITHQAKEKLRTTIDETLRNNQERLTYQDVITSFKSYTETTGNAIQGLSLGDDINKLIQRGMRDFKVDVNKEINKTEAVKFNDFLIQGVNDLVEEKQKQLTQIQNLQTTVSGYGRIIMEQFFIKDKKGGLILDEEEGLKRARAALKAIQTGQTKTTSPGEKVAGADKLVEIGSKIRKEGFVFSMPQQMLDQGYETLKTALDQIEADNISDKPQHQFRASLSEMLQTMDQEAWQMLIGVMSAQEKLYQTQLDIMGEGIGTDLIGLQGDIFNLYVKPIQDFISDTDNGINNIVQFWKMISQEKWTGTEDQKTKLIANLSTAHEKMKNGLETAIKMVTVSQQQLDLSEQQVDAQININREKLKGATEEDLKTLEQENKFKEEAIKLSNEENNLINNQNRISSQSIFVLKKQKVTSRSLSTLYDDQVKSLVRILSIYKDKDKIDVSNFKSTILELKNGEKIVTQQKHIKEYNEVAASIQYLNNFRALQIVEKKRIELELSNTVAISEQKVAKIRKESTKSLDETTTALEREIQLLQAKLNLTGGDIINNHKLELDILEQKLEKEKEIINSIEEQQEALKGLNTKELLDNRIAHFEALNKEPGTIGHYDNVIELLNNQSSNFTLDNMQEVISDAIKELDKLKDTGSHTLELLSVDVIKFAQSLREARIAQELKNIEDRYRDLGMLIQDQENLFSLGKTFGKQDTSFYENIGLPKGVLDVFKNIMNEDLNFQEEYIFKLQIARAKYITNMAKHHDELKIAQTQRDKLNQDYAGKEITYNSDVTKANERIKELQSERVSQELAYNDALRQAYSEQHQRTFDDAVTELEFQKEMMTLQDEIERNNRRGSRKGMTDSQKKQDQLQNEYDLLLKLREIEEEIFKQKRKAANITDDQTLKSKNLSISQKQLLMEEAKALKTYEKNYSKVMGDVAEHNLSVEEDPQNRKGKSVLSYLDGIEKLKVDHFLRVEDAELQHQSNMRELVNSEGDILMDKKEQHDKALHEYAESQKNINLQYFKDLQNHEQKLQKELGKRTKDKSLIGVQDTKEVNNELNKTKQEINSIINSALSLGDIMSGKLWGGEQEEVLDYLMKDKEKWSFKKNIQEPFTKWWKGRPMEEKMKAQWTMKPTAYKSHTLQRMSKDKDYGSGKFNTDWSKWLGLDDIDFEMPDVGKWGKALWDNYKDEKNNRKKEEKFANDEKIERLKQRRALSVFVESVKEGKAWQDLGWGEQVLVNRQGRDPEYDYPARGGEGGRQKWSAQQLSGLYDEGIGDIAKNLTQTDTFKMIQQLEGGMAAADVKSFWSTGDDRMSTLEAWSKGMVEDDGAIITSIAESNNLLSAILSAVKNLQVPATPSDPRLQNVGTDTGGASDNGEVVSAITALRLDISGGLMLRLNHNGGAGLASAVNKSEQYATSYDQQFAFRNKNKPKTRSGRASMTSQIDPETGRNRRQEFEHSSFLRPQFKALDPLDMINQ